MRVVAKRRAMVETFFCSEEKFSGGHLAPMCVFIIAEQPRIMMNGACLDGVPRMSFLSLKAVRRTKRVVILGSMERMGSG
jgi:hypothetical protein